MTYIAKVNMGSGDMPIASALYGTCDTAASTAAKVVTCSSFDKLITGVTIHVSFYYANSASSPTLNVNSTGAKTIRTDNYNSVVGGGVSSWNAGSMKSFTYDGTYWVMNDWEPPYIPAADEIEYIPDDKTVADALDELYDAVPSASSDTPVADGTGSAGSSAAYARGDHVHPLSYSNTTSSTSTRKTQYTKLADGTLICGVWAKVTAAVNTKWTNVYYGSASLGSWPQAFTATPFATATISAQSGSQDAWISLSGVSSSSCGNAFIYRPASTSSASYEVNLVAIGKWK